MQQEACHMAKIFQQLHVSHPYCGSCKSGIAHMVVHSPAKHHIDVPHPQDLILILVQVPYDSLHNTLPLGLGTLALGSSFFFLFFGPLSGSPSAFRFFPFLSSSGFFPAAFLAVLLPVTFFSAEMPSSSLSSSPRSMPFSSSSLRCSSCLAASFALSRASRASFFLCAFSFFNRRHAAICAFAAVFKTLFLQCLHCCKSGLSSSGRPVANVSRDVSSSSLTTGPGEGAPTGEAPFFFLSLER
jgi:hypothetical protein